MNGKRVPCTEPSTGRPEGKESTTVHNNKSPTHRFKSSPITGLTRLLCTEQGRKEGKVREEGREGDIRIVCNDCSGFVLIDP